MFTLQPFSVPKEIVLFDILSQKRFLSRGFQTKKRPDLFRPGRSCMNV